MALSSSIMLSVARLRFVIHHIVLITLLISLGCSYRPVGVGSDPFFCTVSVSFSMAFLNKMVLSSHHFEHAATVLLLQLLVTVILLQSLKHMKLVVIEDFAWSDARQLWLVSLLYALNVGISLSALASLNVAMHSALKRLTILAALFGERLVLHARLSVAVQLSVATIALGALVAGLGDLSFAPLGYLYALISCLCQAAFLVLLKALTFLRRLFISFLSVLGNVF
jgi:hypothetical protein